MAGSTHQIIIRTNTASDDKGQLHSTGKHIPNRLQCNLSPYSPMSHTAMENTL